MAITLDTWPLPSEISALVNHSGTLFIYAATAICYISQGGPLYKSRHSVMANRDIKSVQITDIDHRWSLWTYFRPGL